jgi:hypothetical protein
VLERIANLTMQRFRMHRSLSYDVVREDTLRRSNRCIAQAAEQVENPNESRP